ncbi:hypothetical protein LGL55_01620 [Clostridium tagluense]|uniref:hypothetical protein n=1 Tax=Clostridium tagluense TaxID=360422 RepID=UPI001C0AF605|nr:hypothetical protein [Clostridium tagluense]MBU3126445.1 hypothetical protein [Clostridium tagluense]MCB2309814.1 hypothetical protein [Clostridium tagluense]MCB2314656.1 hypothetical protein [Clostridium tagluense]MCB2319504.1 hypothetical protein [Clostridium tagluense]MCB2324408.1 hypothetical protein [Clostridium tagluense]
MKKTDWRLKLSVLLILSSALLYCFHYFVFRDAHHIFLYIVGDLAFIPIEVLFVSLVIDGVIKIREREALMEKLNLIIGVYFNEVGTTILKYCTSIHPKVDEIANSLIVEPSWEERDFKKALEKCKNYNYQIEFCKVDLERMNEFLLCKREFLLKLLENPNLLEHEIFTHLLTAVFHLQDELSSRNLSKLRDDEKEHLEIDIKRVYGASVSQWVLYMKHLKNAFPYLFVTAMTNNPFDTRTKEEIEKNIKTIYYSK